MTRRQSIKAVVYATCAVATSRVFGQGLTDFALKGLKAGNYPFALPTLPYALDALEPHIDARTLEVHRDIHAAHVKNLNRAIGRNIEYYATWESTLRGSLDAATGRWLRAILTDMSQVPDNVRDAVRDAGGGHYNHSILWQLMGKNGGGRPKGELGKAIEQVFGSFDAFKQRFTEAAAMVFGSGWVWLSLDGKGLRIESTPGEESPLSKGRDVLLGVDVWEHAYYLKYQNRRADYVSAWFNIIDWDFVSGRYQRLKR
jgi:Fe-Mn family superoxide dismutase